MQKFVEICINTHHDNSHQAKLANHCTPGISVSFAEGHPLGPYHGKNSLTKDRTFLDSSMKN